MPYDLEMQRKSRSTYSMRMVSYTDKFEHER